MVIAVTGTSSATTAACPRITGVLTRNTSVTSAAGSPYQRRTHSQLAASSSSRKGSMPSRASVSSSS